MRLTSGEYLDHLRSESARFAGVVAATDPDARVPTCPEWTAADLLWHLAEVQWFWGTVVRKGIVETEQAEQLTLDRPGDLDGLWELFRTAGGALLDGLADVPPETPVWTWADERTVAFVLRRQAHEALVHRVDAELTAGTRTPLDARLAADGVDEALRVMYGETFGGPETAGGPGGPGGPGDAAAADPARALRVRCSDTGDSWRMVLPVPAGGSSDGGVVGAVLQVLPEDDDGPVAATVTGTAEALDCWLWNRPPPGPVRREGDPAALALVDAVLVKGVQ